MAVRGSNGVKLLALSAVGRVFARLCTHVFCVALAPVGFQHVHPHGYCDYDTPRMLLEILAAFDGLCTSHFSSR